ncbi:MAG: NAD(P)H dehydrogenase assembly family protein, partial [Cyanobacteria bacterium P01_A01_bin.116]
MSTSTFNVGDRVKIATVPPFLKSDESMPMLRPPDLVDLGEEGTVR